MKDICMRMCQLSLGLWAVYCLLLIGCKHQSHYQTTGYVEANMVVLSSAVGGVLQKTMVNNSTPVTKGDVILQLNPEPQQQLLEEARAQWRQAHALLDESKQHKGFKTKIDEAEAQVAAASAKVKAAKWAYDQKTITAPATGIINNINYQENEYVPPQSPLVTEFIPSHMKIIFFVPVDRLHRLALGKIVEIILDNKQHYQTIITAIAQQAEFMPDAMFSERNRHRLIYRIETSVPEPLQQKLHGGQAIDIEYE